jgi:hypothetical protein
VARILFLGNSISAQRSGYVSDVAKVLTARESDIEIINSSLGGVGTLGLLALFDVLVSVPRADEVVIESSASDAAGATPLEEVDWAFGQLLRRAAQLHPRRVTVLHLGRQDVSPEHHEKVVRMQLRVSDEQGVCTLDLRDVLDGGAFTDGVHLNARGAEDIGRRVASHLEDVAGPGPGPAVQRSSSVEFVPVEDIRWDVRGADVARFRAALPTVRLQVGQHATVNAGAAEPVALVVIVGPSSGVVRLSGGGDIRAVQWRDAWCATRRIQVVHVPHQLRRASMLHIEPASENSAETDAWGMPTAELSAPAVAELVGLLVRRPSELEKATHA